MSLLAMQRRRLQCTQNRVVLYSLRGRRCSRVAIPSARSLTCEIVRRGGRGHMRDCGTGDGRRLPEDTGRARVGQLRGCQIHGSRPLATRDPRALRGRDASYRRGERFGTPAQSDQHVSLARGGPGSLRERRREAYYGERREIAFFGRWFSWGRGNEPNSTPLDGISGAVQGPARDCRRLRYSP